MKENSKIVVLTGNEAIAHGAFEAGVGYAGCFPGGPTTEVVYTIANLAKDNKPHVEWSINEKVALESSSGAAMSGVRALSVMKHFGVNNAADQLFSINLMGIPGLVLVVGDDPHGHSSHSEQDTRSYPIAAEIPCIEPATPQDAYEMIKAAYTMSENARLPVYYRVVKWLCHGASPVELNEERTQIGTPLWDDNHFQTRPIVKKHLDLHKRLSSLEEVVESWPWNAVEGPEGNQPLGIVAAGYAYVIVRETLDSLGLSDKVPVFKLTTINPLPSLSLRNFLNRHNKVLVVEEGEKLIEDRLKILAYEEGLTTPIVGRKGGYLPAAGEIKGEKVREAIIQLLSLDIPMEGLPAKLLELEGYLPERKPAPRPGNPHRPTIYAVREFIRRSKRKVVFMGDVGESATMARPLMKSHAAMGAGIGMAVGAAGVDPEATVMTIVGDGTLYGFALNGIASAVYNKNKVIILVCDNGTMESTGWQPTPTSGQNLTGEAPELDICSTLQGLGIQYVQRVDSRSISAVVNALEQAAEIEGPSVVLAYGRYEDSNQLYSDIKIDSKMGKELYAFIREFECPALGWNGETAYIDSVLCTRCGDCAMARPDAIQAVAKEVKI